VIEKNGHMNITTNNVLGCFYIEFILHLTSSRFKLLIKENGTHPKINNSILGHIHGHNKKNYDVKEIELIFIIYQ
jgi:hypothetical protein